MIKVACRFVRMPSGRSADLTFDLSAIKWVVHGPLPGRRLSAKALDLIEVSRVIHETDRSMPRRISTERTARFDVVVPVRRPAVWKRAREALADLLYVQGGVDWRFDFIPRSQPTGLDALATNCSTPRLDKSRARSVILFSGGLDSTSGLATLRKMRQDHVLVSAFSRNLVLQQDISKALGYDNHIQVQGTWTTPRGAKIGGQFQHRSLYYLCLGAAFLDALEGDKLYQFENGPLALAIPPAPVYRMTRHAHPAMHRAAETLFRQVLGRDITIVNPFIGLTKRQAMKPLATGTFRNEIARAETCWNVRATTVVGAGPKSSKTPCGTCIPCIVRRAATGTAEGTYAVDLTSRSDPYFKDEVVRVHLDAYLAFARRVSDRSYGFGDLLREMPAVTETAILDQGALTPEATLKLYKTFASELLDVFDTSAR
jgi:7-cyano-7-deazaguanine synthase in queuosine biosynthesis